MAHGVYKNRDSAIHRPSGSLLSNPETPLHIRHLHIRCRHHRSFFNTPFPSFLLLLLTSPKENSPGKFQWRGPPVQTVWGIHSFIFEESKVTPGRTTFRQTEDLSGALSFLMHPALMGKGIKEKFEGFNADLKKKAESAAAAGGE